MTQETEKLCALVKELSDPYAWNWARMMDRRQAADCILTYMHDIGLIEEFVHPYGGSFYRVGGKRGRLFGRLDGINPKTLKYKERKAK